MVLEGLPHPQVTIEHYRDVIGLISAPGFRQALLKTSEFAPNSAARSRRLAFDTLRPHALNDNDRDVEIDVTAASDGDCRAIYRNIANKILQRHALLFDQKAKLLQAAIDSYQMRADQLGKWRDAKASASEHQTEVGSEGLKPDTWAETTEQLYQLQTAKTLMQKTTFPPEEEIFINGPLTDTAVRISALAGLVIILCTVLLGLALESHSSKPRNT
jgi:hypothetical protein